MSDHVSRSTVAPSPAALGRRVAAGRLDRARRQAVAFAQNPAVRRRVSDIRASIVSDFESEGQARSDERKRGALYGRRAGSGVARNSADSEVQLGQLITRLYPHLAVYWLGPRPIATHPDGAYAQVYDNITQRYEAADVSWERSIGALAISLNSDDPLNAGVLRVARGWSSTPGDRDTATVAYDAYDFRVAEQIRGAVAAFSPYYGPESLRAGASLPPLPSEASPGTDVVAWRKSRTPDVRL